MYLITFITLLGNVFLNGNPWICDCSTIAFTDWQTTEATFFRESYSDADGHVQLGTCRYPYDLRYTKFEDLNVMQVQCVDAEVVDESEETIKVSKPDEIFVTLTGHPLPDVTWYVNGTNVGDGRLQLLDLDQDKNKVYAKYTLDTLSDVSIAACKNSCKVRADFVYWNSDSRQKTLTKEFNVTVSTASGLGLRIIAIFLLIILSFLICWRYRYSDWLI